MKKFVLAALLSVVGLQSAWASCSMCTMNGGCVIVNGNGFNNCGPSGCSGNCYGSAPTIPSDGGYGGSWGGGWGPGHSWDGPRPPRTGPAPTVPEFRANLEKFPDAKPLAGQVLHEAHCTNCGDAPHGPAFQAMDAEKVLAETDNDWLVAAAIIQFERSFNTALPDSGAYAFVLADSQKKQDAVLSGISLAHDSGKKNKPDVGYTEFRTTSSSGQHTIAGNKFFDVEMHIWHVNQQKGVPVQGEIAHLRYEESVKGGGWALLSIKVEKEFAKPSKGIFPAMDANFSEFKQLVQAQ